MAQRVFELIIRYPLVASRVSFLHSEMLERDREDITSCRIGGCVRYVITRYLTRAGIRAISFHHSREKCTIFENKKMYAENILIFLFNAKQLCGIDAK